MGKAKRLRKERRDRKRKKENDAYWKARFLAEVKYEAEKEMGKHIANKIVRTLFDAWFEVFKEDNAGLIGIYAKDFELVETAPGVLTERMVRRLKEFVDKENM